MRAPDALRTTAAFWRLLGTSASPLVTDTAHLLRLRSVWPTRSAGGTNEHGTLKEHDVDIDMSLNYAMSQYIQLLAYAFGPCNLELKFVVVMFGPGSKQPRLPSTSRMVGFPMD